MCKKWCIMWIRISIIYMSDLEFLIVKMIINSMSLGDWTELGEVTY